MRRNTAIPDTARSFNNLADFHEQQAQYSRAAPLYTRALAIDEKILGLNDPVTSVASDNLAILFAESSQPTQAREILLFWIARLEQDAVSGALSRQSLKTGGLCWLLKRYSNLRPAG
jgi:hypothetical protein